MSVLIKGMKMPTRCGRCDMCIKEVDGDIDYHYECCITAAVIKNLGEKMVDCPLVSVPPHGRLIDADALIEDLKYDVELDAVALDSMETVGDERRKIQEDKDFKQNCIFWIEDAPTIIPAKEGE